MDFPYDPNLGPNQSNLGGYRASVSTGMEHAPDVETPSINEASFPIPDNQLTYHTWNTIPQHGMAPMTLSEDEAMFEEALDGKIGIPGIVNRIMKHAIPRHVKISKEAKRTMGDCVSEFILFITGEAAEIASKEKRATLLANDVIASLNKLGMENYGHAMQLYIDKYRQIRPRGDTAATQMKGLEEEDPEEEEEEEEEEDPEEEDPEEEDPEEKDPEEEDPEEEHLQEEDSCSHHPARPPPAIQIDGVLVPTQDRTAPTVVCTR
ncbi:histone-fold-containing protein [Bombardia bombarda]|uniref:Histone-fold-containing protein n=1 Tax=Bombardia bombarda TaxID=252184 RepID=A0AA39TZH4_9PEZI|nr:histone-fold-containing protein [Bombardia bombarda]